jgi:hypothetical protein
VHRKEWTHRRFEHGKRADPAPQCVLIRRLGVGEIEYNEIRALQDRAGRETRRIGAHGIEWEFLEL